LNPPSGTHRIPLKELRRHFCGTAYLLEPLPSLLVDFLRLQFTAVTLLRRKEIVGLGHFNTLDFGIIQNLKRSATGIAVFGLVLYSGFFPSRTGSCAALTAYVVGFRGHSIPPSFNSPFDFAFFAHVTPGRCPHNKVPEILSPPPLLLFEFAFTFLLDWL
jgi:hypothetical protein